MGKTILYIAQSLDGYIATEDNSIEFLNKYAKHIEVINYYKKFIETIDIQVMGSKTYNEIIKQTNGIWPYTNHISYVFTTKIKTDNEYIKFVNKDVINFVKELQKQDKNIWIVGGSKIVKPLVQNNLIDEYVICVSENILGNGVKLFDHVKNEKLNLTKVRKTKNLVWLYYKK